MKAAVIYKHGGTENIILEKDYPDPIPGNGEVILKVHACSLNHHDIFTRRGMPGVPIHLPVVTGSDISGEIVELGKSVKSCRVGDRVLANPGWQSGRKFGMLGETEDGGKAEYVKVKASQLIALPENLDYKTAATLPLAYGTAHRMLITRGRVNKNDRVLIIGASGGVGVACIQLAKQIGAEVAACSNSNDKLKALGEIGADHSINASHIDIHKAVYDIWGKPHSKDGTGGATVIVNFTGGETWAKSLKCLKKNGKLLTCGATAGYDPRTDIRYIWTFEQNIIGSDGWKNRDLVSVVKMAADATIRPVIHKSYALDDVAVAERQMEERNVIGKILIEP